MVLWDIIYIVYFQWRKDDSDNIVDGAWYNADDDDDIRGAQRVVEDFTELVVEARR